MPCLPACLAVVAVLSAMHPTALLAQARTIRVYSEAAGGDRIAAVLLPAGYADSRKRYPVVYLFHGGGQDHTAFMARRAFLPITRRHEAIIVMPAADRTYTGLPAAAQSRFHDFVARELVDYVDANYRTIASRDGRAIGGISMGGRVATMTALQHPQRFGVVGAFSAAIRTAPDGDAAIEGEAAPYFYVSCGTADSLIDGNRAFVAWLKGRSAPHEYHEIPGGDHSWSVWDVEVGVFFELLQTRLAPAAGP
jgi:S-formylglutathione hydrolase FrmB